jgi:hypothetical protein
MCVHVLACMRAYMSVRGHMCARAPACVFVENLLKFDMKFDMFSWEMGKIAVAELVNSLTHIFFTLIVHNFYLYWLELQNLANSKYPYTIQQHAVENFFFFTFSCSCMW